MPVATPLSLENVYNEFGYNSILTQTFDSGSGSVTAPSDARAVAIKIWGGGGGGENGGEFAVGQGGGGGGFILKSLNVTGGSTSISYSVGAAGDGNFGPAQLSGVSGGNTSVTINSTTYIAYGGIGGANPDGVGGGTSNNGDVNESGQAGTYGAGGAAGGLSYGGGVADTTPGGGGNGGQYASSNGGSGRVSIEWLGIALSEYTRGGGLVPNHSQNSNIPTSTTNLKVSNFNDAGLDFTATITGDGGANYGYSYGTFGSIDRDQFGINRNNTDQRTIWALYETRTLTYDLLGSPNGYAYYLTLEIDGDTRSSTLGYNPILAVKVNNLTMVLDSVSYTFGTTKYTNAFGRQGSLVADAWSFDQTNGAQNPITIFFNAPRFKEYISSNTYTSGSATFSSGTPISRPAGATVAVARLWGGGAGGSGGTGGGGGGFIQAEIDLAPNEVFYYSVENGGNFGIAGQNGGNTSISSNTNIFYSAIAYGGIWDGTGGTTGTGFGTPWTIVSENGGNNSGSNGGDAGGLSYGGGAGGAGAGATPGAGGASGFAGGEARLIIDWYKETAIPSIY